MIRAMRRQAPRLLALAALCTAYVAAAQVVISNVPAPVTVTFPEVKVFVYVTLAAVLATVLALSGSVAVFVLSRDRAADTVARAALAAAIEVDHKVREEQFAVIGKAIETVGKAVAELVEVQKKHDEYPFAHPAVAHALRKEMGDRVDRLSADVAGLVAWRDAYEERAGGQA